MLTSIVETHLSLDGSEPKCRSYALIVATLMSNAVDADPNTFTDRQSLVASEGNRHRSEPLLSRLLSVAVTDASSGDVKLATCALEVLCWIAAGEASISHIFAVQIGNEQSTSDHDGERSPDLSGSGRSSRVLLGDAVLGALERPEKEIRLTALFLLAEQHMPEAFRANLYRALKSVNAQILEASSVVTEANSIAHIPVIYAMGALSRLIEQFPDACAAWDGLETRFLRAVIDGGLLSSQQRLRAAALQLLERGLSRLKAVPAVSSFIKSNTQYFMDNLNAMLSTSPTGPEDMVCVHKTCSEVALLWRAWVRLIAPMDLPPLLRLGSTGPDAAGYLLKSVEIMFSCSAIKEHNPRLEATMCWQTVASSIISIESWWVSHKKIVKLLLRCIVHVLDTEQRDAAVILGIGASLELLMSDIWPAVDLLLNLPLNSSGSSTLSKTLHKHLIAADVINAVSSGSDLAGVHRGAIFGSLPGSVWCAKLMVSVKCLYCPSCCHVDLSGGKISRRRISPAFSLRAKPLSENECSSDSEHMKVIEALSDAMRALLTAHHLVMQPATTEPGEDFVLERRLCQDMIEEAVTCCVITFQSSVFYIGRSLVQRSAGAFVTASSDNRSSPGATGVQQRAFPSSYISPLKTDNGSSTEDNNDIPGSASGHVIYTMDSDGYEHPVLTSASSPVVDAVDRIFHTVVIDFVNLWMTDFGDLFAYLREYFVESFWWLLHRLSAYDIEPTALDVDILSASVRDMHLLPPKDVERDDCKWHSDRDQSNLPFNLAGEVPTVMLGMALLMSVAHAYRLPAQSRVMEMDETTSFNSGAVSTLIAAIKRSMKSITESRTLPGAFRWLPWLTRRLVLGDHANSRGHDNSFSVIYQESTGQTTCDNCIRSSDSLKIVGAFATAAAKELANMPVTDSGSVSGDGSTQTCVLLGNMIKGLLNLMTTPLFSLCFRPDSLSYFVTNTAFAGPVSSVSSEDGSQCWGKLVETILQFDEVYIADFLALINHVSLSESTIIINDSAPVENITAGCRLGCRLISIFISSLSRSSALRGGQKKTTLLLKQLNQTFLRVLATRILPEWASSVIIAVRQMDSVTPGDENTCVALLGKIKNVFSVDFAQTFARYTFMMENIDFGASIVGFFGTEDNYTTSNVFSLALNFVFLSVLHCLSHVSNIPDAQLDKGCSLARNVLETVYVFVLKYTAELSRSANAGSTDITIFPLLKNELSYFYSNFVRSPLTVKSDLAYQSVAELIKELGVLETDSPVRNVRLGNTDDNAAFVATAKRSYIVDRADHINCTVSPLPKKIKRAANEISSPEFIAAAGSVFATPQSTRLKARQWSGIPMTYSTLDRDNMMSQSQEILTASHGSQGSNSYANEELRGTVTEPIDCTHGVCVDCSIQKMLVVLSTLSKTRGYNESCPKSCHCWTLNKDFETGMQAQATRRGGECLCFSTNVEVSVERQSPSDTDLAEAIMDSAANIVKGLHKELARHS